MTHNVERTPRFARVLAVLGALFGIEASGCATTVEGLSPRREAGVARAPEVHSPSSLRFAVIADTGRDGPAQRQLAALMRETCAGTCDFTLFMGDNLYYEGIRPEYADEDRARLACLLGRYPEGPKYLVLGNHDYHPVLPSLERATAQLRFLEQPGDSFEGAFHFYRFDTPLAAFFGVDSNYLVRRVRPESEPKPLRRFARAVAAAGTPWVIAFGHHPLRSNGLHGNAGDYREGDRYRFWSGDSYRSFMLRHVVPHADLYLSGHDHSMQFYPRIYGSRMAQAIAGSGSKCNARSSAPANDAMMERYGHGYAIVEATSEELAIRYHGADGRPFFEARRGRRSPWRATLPAAGAVDPGDHCAEDAARLAAADQRADATPCPPAPGYVPDDDDEHHHDHHPHDAPPDTVQAQAQPLLP
ncbi:MAG: metallophosphoesterase [Myxococcota bacterium]